MAKKKVMSDLLASFVTAVALQYIKHKMCHHDCLGRLHMSPIGSYVSHGDFQTIIADALLDAKFKNFLDIPEFAFEFNIQQKLYEKQLTYHAPTFYSVVNKLVPDKITSARIKQLLIEDITLSIPAKLKGLQYINPDCEPATLSNELLTDVYHLVKKMLQYNITYQLPENIQNDLYERKWRLMK